MNRRTFLVGAAGLAACRLDRRPRLNVFNWSGYIAPDTVPKFEAEFGVRVRYGVYESNEEMLARVMSGNSGWDIVFPTNYIVKPMLANELLAPLDHSCSAIWRQLEAAIPASRLGSGTRMVGALHGDRSGHRLQPQAGPAAARLGRHVGRRGCAGA